MRTIKKCVFSSTLAGNSFAASPFLFPLLVLRLVLFLLLELHLLLHLHAHLANIRLSARPAYYAHAERDATHSICAFPASATPTPHPHAPAPPSIWGEAYLADHVLFIGFVSRLETSRLEIFSSLRRSPRKQNTISRK